MNTFHTVVNTCSFVFDSALNQYKTQELYDKPDDDNPSTIKYVRDRYKTQEICDKSVGNNPNALEFVLDWYKTQEMSDKAVNDYSIKLGNVR